MTFKRISTFVPATQYLRQSLHADEEVAKLKAAFLRDQAARGNSVVGNGDEVIVGCDLSEVEKATI